MANVIELILKGRKDTSVDAMFQGARRDLDAIAAKWKSTPLTPKVELRPITDAKARITELERTLQSWQRVSQRGGTIMPGDLSQIKAAKSELESLKRGLAELQGGGQTGLSNRGFGRLGEALQGVGLGGIVGAASVAGVAALGAGAAKAVIELGNLGQTVRQQRAYFEVWSGGVEQATRNLDAMRRAVGSSMTDSEAMGGANKLLSMGLAKNADDLERLSRMAVMLGGSTRTASESIEEFSLLLANQSILRLDTFGISGAKVRARIEELQKATPGLSREQAFLNAVMEEGARKVDALSAAGVRATTASQDLGAAWRGLKEEIAQGIDTSGPMQGIAQQITDLTRSMRIDSGRGSISDLKAEIESLQQTMQRDLNGKPKWLQDWIQTASDIPEELQRLQKELYISETSAQKWGDVGAGASERVKEALQGAQGAVGDVNSELDASKAYWDAWAGFAEDAAFRASTAAYAARSAMGRGAIDGTTSGTFTEPTKTRWGMYGEWGSHFTQTTTADDPVKAWLKRQQDANKTAATDYQKAYERAAEKMSGRIQGYLSQGVNASIGLLDTRRDIFKPGANGPFENLFRTLDVAKQGGASPWASALGLTQEQAKKISEDFQRGIFSPEVIGLVDVDALVNEAKMAELAEKTQAAFAEKIAKQAGVKTNLVSNLFGYGSGGGEGEKTGAVAQKQVNAAMQQVATTVGDAVKGKDFAGKIIGYGNSIWGYFEKGIVEQAKQSDGLQRAIDEMVAKALAQRSGGSATSAARSQGVPGV